MMMATVRLAGTDFTRARCGAFFRDAETAIRNIPGVVAIGFGDQVLELDLERYTPVKRDPAETLRSRAVGVGFFRALGVPVVRGREFSFGVDNSRSVILNQTAANHLFLEGIQSGKRLAQAWLSSESWATQGSMIRMPLWLEHSTFSSRPDPRSG